MDICEGRYEGSIDCKIEYSCSPERVLAIQLAENTSSNPPKERKAMAIVGLYRHGLKTGKWTNKKQFIDYSDHSGNKISRYELNEALYFVELPQELQEFIFNGSLAYVIGAELGKATSVVRKYLAFRHFNNQEDTEMTESEIKELDNLEKTWLQVRVAHIQNERMNGPAATKHIQALANQYATEMRVAESVKELPFEMVSPDRQRKEYLHGLQLELDRLIRTLADKSVTANANALRLHTQLHPRGETLRHEIEEKLKKTLKIVGNETMQVSKIEVSTEA
jgi:hypothetical protein